MNLIFWHPAERKLFNHLSSPTPAPEFSSSASSMEEGDGEWVQKILKVLLLPPDSILSLGLHFQNISNGRLFTIKEVRIRRLELCLGLNGASLHWLLWLFDLSSGSTNSALLI
ncbi:hypothetical protein GOODEAATRI_015857 [Goodea atripinnis]|uniref:Uncharacterized protein n=1 Tax=Goodea atripinnis TaxID=208336 RepID=A0ABV0NKN0_9TELE